MKVIIGRITRRNVEKQEDILNLKGLTLVKLGTLGRGANFLYNNRLFMTIGGECGVARRGCLTTSETTWVQCVCMEDGKIDYIDQTATVFPIHQMTLLVK